MKLLIVSAAPLIPTQSGWAAYGPYVKEMEIWRRHTDTLQFCCPIWKDDRGLLVSDIRFPMEQPIELAEFDVKSFLNFFKSFFVIFYNIYILFNAIRHADHIHLRCPGNIGLLGCFVQIFFPNKIKTAKYAGNWDPNAKQPLSYRLQKQILSNTFFTRNMQVLVYGEWPESTINIKPFFTATYSENEKESTPIRNLSGRIRFLFVGTLSEGKRPLYAIQLIAKLHQLGFDVTLDLYGEGKERSMLENYIDEMQLTKFVLLHGNQSSDILKKAYKTSHFLILLSKSEGWPKAVAEAMFWGCVPISTRVSCVANMLKNGERGLLLDLEFDTDVRQIEKEIKNNEGYRIKAQKAISWSQNYTTDFFESEIKKLLQK